MKRVSRCVVLRCAMALFAHSISCCAQTLRMWIVTVRARHARVIHAALEKRDVRVHFVALLPIGIIERIDDERRNVIVEEIRSGGISFCNLYATRMTRCTRFDLAVSDSCRGSSCVSRRIVDRPSYAASLVQSRRHLTAPPHPALGDLRIFSPL